MTQDFIETREPQRAPVRRTRSPRSKHVGSFLVSALVACLLVASPAWAKVTLSGDWPKTEKNVSLSLSQKPRAEAVRALAEAAGWSIVLEGVAGDATDLHVKDQEPAKLLELLLEHGDFEARRDGNLVSIKPRSGPTLVAGGEAPASDALPGLFPVPGVPPVPAVPPVPPLSRVAADAAGAGSGGSSSDDDSAAADDRVIFGDSVHVKKDETVRDLVVLGGSVVVEGTVTGDLVLMGGSAEVKEGARVRGDAVIFGGSLDIEKGARVDGEKVVFGGSVRGDQPSHKKPKKHKKHSISIETGPTPHTDASEDREEQSWSFGGMARDAARAVAKTAVLWLVGAMLLAWAARRIERLEVEILSRPLRSFGVGIVASIVAALAAIILLVTIIGIPVALVGVLCAVLAGYVGVCAVLTALGNALGRHRTDNAYVHLAIGCVVFLIVTSIPYVGDIAMLVAVMTGFGAFVATRGAGLFGSERSANAEHDYSSGVPA